MPIRSRQVLWGLTALALLSACGVDAETSGKTSTSRTSTTPAASPDTTTSGTAAPLTTQGPRTQKWIDLSVGDCLADLPPTDPSVVTVNVVDCTTAHQAEVYFRAAMAVNAAIADVANRDCDVGFSQYTGRPIGGSPFAVTYLIDSNQDRTSSNPAPSTVICLLYAADGRSMTQSAHQ
jgi:hypothetical protein